jgi:hypothetical protein
MKVKFKKLVPEAVKPKGELVATDLVESNIF